ncbi:MAG: Yip1 family protein [Acidobacteriota bacterium]
MSDPNQVFQAPPPPPFAPTPAPPAVEMSTPQTLTSIFFEPGRTFEALRSRPRFLIAGLILLVLTCVVTAVLFVRKDMTGYIRDKMEQSQSNQNATPEQKELGLKIGTAIAIAGFPLSVPFWIAAGAALYLLGVMAFGGTISYKQALSVWVYSSVPPAILGTIVAILVLFLKAADQIDPEHMLITNPGAFMGADSSKVLTAILSQFDVLRFYGLFLAAIGLKKVAKMSSGAAWGVVILLFLIRAIFGIASAAIFGR